VTLLAPNFPQSTSSFRLTEADSGFWVANKRGAFAGTIDQQDDHVYLRDCFGRYLGDYATLLIAQQHLELYLTSADA
jgi:hypothetical protein